MTVTPQVEGTFLRRSLSSLRSRNFRLFFIGQAISNSGNWLTTVALTLLVLHRTDSGAAVGILSACQFGPILLLSAWAGVIVDRMSKRTLLFLTQALEMAQSFVLAALAFAPDAPLGAFYVTAAVGGCLLAFDNPVRRSFVSEMVPRADVSNAVTLYSAMVNISRIVGPALAGALIVGVGYACCFIVDGCSYLAVLLALGMMRIAELRATPVTRRGAGQVRAGLRYVANVRELWVTFVMMLLIGVLSYNFTVVFPLFVEKGLHAGDTDYTLIYSSFSVGSLLGAALVARRPTVTTRTVTVGAAWFGVTMLALSVAPNVPVALLAAAAVGVGSVAFMTAATTIAQIRTDQAMVGRVLALQTVVMIGTTPLGGPVLGSLADTIGGRWPVVIGGLGALTAALFGARYGGPDSDSAPPGMPETR